ncbi:PREDICTED: leucoanthocyanidin reductase [Theobroma cacao]|uniref:Leucoanthocyanidin reductase n=1 Tax=Theobroma cacao TaxID=3641 RepID=A0AB32W1E5_THECC|nr:PREDICTED: leucoanthocyanidin reductase [Theobroma cacao]
MKSTNMNGSSPNVSEETGRTLVVGSGGFIGRFVTEASLDSGRPTYILARSSSNSPSKASTIKFLQDRGATVIYGSITDKEFMEKVLKEHKIEVVISAVGGGSILDQFNLIEAIRNVDTVKRFLPSEFGHDTDRADPVEPGLTMYEQKRQIRRQIEKSGIPYTYICCNSIAAWPYHDNTHPADVLPPLDRFKIYGDGTVKAYFVAGTDIGKFTIMSIEDDRTLNKTVHFQPPSNLLNINEMASLWEEKIGRTLPRVTITEEDLLQMAKEMRIPQSVVAALTHDIFINGCQINFSLDKPTDVEVCSLYPDTPFRTINECFEDFAKKIIDNAKAVSKPAASNNAIFVPTAKPGALPITAICT